MMKLLPLLVAASEPLTPGPLPLPDGKTSNLTSFQMRDILLIGGATLAMALILFLWAYLTRKNRQQEAAASRGTRLLTKPERHSSHPHGRKVKIRKRRRENAEELGRNPTLAEAGGLPPPRPEEPEPTPAPSPDPLPIPPPPPASRSIQPR